MKRFLKTLGPGLLFASTAIGVSHLVQSTRAGADFGFLLVPFIIAANLFKYPFFQYGSRYANATGESIIDGYQRIGRWMLWLYFIITLGSMFFVSAAVGAVTSGFLQNLFGISDWGVWATVVLFAFCLVVLLIGNYSALDSLTKIIGVVLLVSTLLAFTLALFQGPVVPLKEVSSPDIWSDKSVLFIIALMGWMPTAVDLSAWNSLWTIERIKQTKYRPSLRETIFEFNFGYILSSVLALFFVVLGAYMLYGSEKELPNSGGAFANEVVGMFTTFIGDWSYIIIAASAFSIMFGTCITVFDGYGRALEKSTELLFLRRKSNQESSVMDGCEESKTVWYQANVYRIALLLVVTGSFSILYFFTEHLKSLVDLATTISFLIAPLIAVMNYRLVTKYVSDEAKPGIGMRILSVAGIIFLGGFAIYFLWIKFIQ